MYQQFHDNINIQNNIEHPDFFVAIPCIPDWQKNIKALILGHTP